MTQTNSALVDPVLIELVTDADIMSGSDGPTPSNIFRADVGEYEITLQINGLLVRGTIVGIRRFMRYASYRNGNLVESWGNHAAVSLVNRAFNNIEDSSRTQGYRPEYIHLFNVKISTPGSDQAPVSARFWRARLDSVSAFFFEWWPDQIAETAAAV